MSELIGSTCLPHSSPNWLIRKVQATSTLRLIFIGIIVYALLTVAFSGLFYFLSSLDLPLVRDGSSSPIIDFGNLVYFNFITILTVGYGDLHPVEIGRMFAVVEALIGVGLFGLIIGVVIIKVTNPKDNSIVFSKYGYYSSDRNTFFVIFVNTTGSPFVNVLFSSILKMGRENRVRPPLSAPYISDSLWDLYLHEVPPEVIRDVTLYSDDGLKFGLSGNFGFATFATAIKYTLDDILVVPNSDVFDNNPLTLHPSLSSAEFATIFHYKPEGAITFRQYAERLKHEHTENG